MAHALLASCLAELQQWQQALAEAKPAIDPAPEYPYLRITCTAGFIRSWAHRYAAKTACLESLRLDPHHAGYHSQLAFIYLHTEQWAGRHAAECGLEIDPEHIGCLNCLAWVLAVEGKKTQSIRVINRALEIDPNSDQTHSNLGRLLIAMDRHDLAVDSLQESLRLNPADQEHDQADELWDEEPQRRLLLGDDVDQVERLPHQHDAEHAQRE